MGRDQWQPPFLFLLLFYGGWIWREAEPEAHEFSFASQGNVLNWNFWWNAFTLSNKQQQCFHLWESMQAVFEGLSNWAVQSSAVFELKSLSCWLQFPVESFMEHRKLDFYLCVPSITGMSWGTHSHLLLKVMWRQHEWHPHFWQDYGGPRCWKPVETSSITYNVLSLSFLVVCLTAVKWHGKKAGRRESMHTDVHNHLRLRVCLCAGCEAGVAPRFLLQTLSSTRDMRHTQCDWMTPPCWHPAELGSGNALMSPLPPTAPFMVGADELVLNSFTSWQELHSKPWK